jgi:hypothetical protein
VPFVFGVMLAGIAQPSHSRGAETVPGDVRQQQGEAMQPAPSCREADKNGDQYVSKEELQGYPYLLKRFDEVDAGKTGRLEEHEYGNLVMEKSREKGR